MVGLLCAGDSQRQAEALTAATEALEARLRLWNGIGSQLGVIERSRS
jgi:hypothetical protein